MKDNKMYNYRGTLIPAVLLLLFAITCVTTLSAMQYTPRELIVKLREPAVIRGNDFEIAELDRFLAEFTVREIKPVTPSATNLHYVVRLESGFEWESLRRRIETGNLRNSARIEYIQPNYLSEMLVKPNDPLFSQQYLDLMRVSQAWNYETGSEQIVVALIDSGLWFDHPEFICESNIWINEAEYPPNGEDSCGNGYIDDWRGWNFVDAPELADIALGKFIGQDNEPFDESGHGTHVAGIVGAKTNNGIGVAGICWDVKLMILRAGFRTTTGTGYLQDDDAAAAIIYAADNGAHVINISWGSHTFSRIIADACQYAFERGVVIVASAGNTPQPSLMYPAKLNTTIGVGAVDNNLNLTGFSSYGPDLDIVAPGQNILSTYLEQDGEYYRRLSGTSMSAPYVTAAVALLLSKEPGLKFDEVKSRLFSSARDLGTPGFNNTFGHGLLDLEKLLTTTYRPYINVTYPFDNRGLSQTFDIIGTIRTDNFFRYSVMFTEVTEPGELDWKDVETHLNHPKFFYSQVEDDVIATFYVPYTLPDNDYLVRIRLETIESNRSRIYEKRFRVWINKSIPNLRHDVPLVTKRYERDKPCFFVKADFDQAVTLQLDLYQDISSALHSSVFSNYADSVHILRIPDDFPDGDFFYRLTATNSSGLEYVSPLFPGGLVIERRGIPTDLFTSQPSGPALIAVGKSHDFFGNGMPEFVGMDISDQEQSGVVKVFELQANRRMVPKHVFETSFLPLDLGNTNSQGMELFGLRLDEGILFETYGDSIYPHQPLWAQRDIVGGNFCYWNSLGHDKLLLIRNLQNDRVVSVYEREGNFFNEKNILRNTTPTDTRNNFVPRVAAGDLNRNGYMNVLTADTDGDIMVFEIYNPEEDSLVFHHRLNVPNAYHPAIADFTGDGNLEFVVGGYSYVYTDPNKIYWHFEFFGFNATSQKFESIGYVSFNHFESINSIRAIDLTGDGKSELVVAATPYLYVISYQDNEFKPVWKGLSQSTYQVIPIAENLFTPAGVIVNAYYENTLYSHFVTKSDFAGPASPTGLAANPLNESSIVLDWDDCQAEKYYILRTGGTIPDEGRFAGDNLPLNDFLLHSGMEVIDSVYTTSYTDVNLEQGVEYHYALLAYNSAYTPRISRMTPVMSAVPYAVPNLISVRMSGMFELQLLFDTQLSNDAVNVGYYSVNNGVGIPSSVNHTYNQNGLLLKFNNALKAPAVPYHITINGLLGRSGVPFPVSRVEFAFNDDLDPPRIYDYRVTDKKILEVYFTKTIRQDIAETATNYELLNPMVDPFNYITAIVCTDSVVVFSFYAELKVSNQAYSLKMSNIRDLSGNVIPNNENILKFRVTDINNLDYLQVVPNPFVRTRAGHNDIKFIGLPLEQTGDFYIYSLSGELVYKDNIRTLTESRSEWVWNTVNNSGQKVSSGTYFYIIKMGEHIKRGQLVIVN